MSAKRRLLLFDAKGGTGLQEVRCGDLQDFYDALGCDCINIARVKVGGKYFDIFVDDEALLKNNPVVSAISFDMRPALVDNLIFANRDRRGKTTSLTDEDIEIIKSCVITLINYDADPIESWEVIFPIDY